MCASHFEAFAHHLRVIEAHARGRDAGADAGAAPAPLEVICVEDDDDGDAAVARASADCSGAGGASGAGAAAAEGVRPPVARSTGIVPRQVVVAARAARDAVPAVPRAVAVASVALALAGRECCLRAASVACATGASAGDRLGAEEVTFLPSMRLSLENARGRTIVTPARGLECSHVQCFDLAEFLTGSPGDARGRACLVCGCALRAADLTVDSLMAEIIAAVSCGGDSGAGGAGLAKDARGARLRPPHVVDVLADGSWTAPRGVACSPSDDDGGASDGVSWDEEVVNIVDDAPCDIEFVDG